MENLRTAGCAMALWVVSLSGCQMMIQSANPLETLPTRDEIAVQVRPAYGKSRTVSVPFEPNMCLQDVVDKSKPRFRNKQAYIVRTSPTSGEKHKLEGEFAGNRRISLETDYAVQPGDRVVISQDTSTSFDRVMRALLGRS